jgi:hypothetical protein
MIIPTRVSFKDFVMTIIKIKIKIWLYAGFESRKKKNHFIFFATYWNLSSKSSNLEFFEIW